jgi:hypothetical protein
MSSNKNKPPRFSNERMAQLCAQFDAARAADEKLGADATKWVDDLPEAPPLDSEHITAISITRLDDQER